MTVQPAFSVYVYYRVEPGSVVDLLPKLRRAQAAVADEFGATAKLLRKRDDATLMEVYEGVGNTEALLARLDEALEGIGFAGHLAAGGVRHVEQFECA